MAQYVDIYTKVNGVSHRKTVDAKQVAQFTRKGWTTEDPAKAKPKKGKAK